MKKIVIAHPVGQLGNRLFVSAHFLAFSAASKGVLFNPALGEYADFFEGSCGDFWCAYPKAEKKGALVFPRFLRRFFVRSIDAFAGLLGGIEKRFGLKPRVLDIIKINDQTDKAYNLESREFSKLLRGEGTQWVRGWKFRFGSRLAEMHGEVARYFRPVREVMERVESRVAEARKGVDLLLGVHIRQGDYKDWQGGKYYYETSRYHRWMQQAQMLWPEQKVGFLVCSNSPLSASDFPGCAVAFGPGDPVADLYCLAACDRLIGPPSTFSLWASFYGRAPLHMLERAEQDLHPETFTLHDRV